MSEASAFASLRELRDEINRSSCGPRPVSRGRAILTRLLASCGFVLAFLIALRSAPLIVVQFVVGAALLFVLERAMARLRSSRLPAEIAAPPELARRSGLELAMLEGLFDLYAARRSDFPIQQNALLALALIALPPVLEDYPEGGIRWLGIVLVLGAVDFAVRTWLEARDETLSWRQAAAAVAKLRAPGPRQAS